MDVNKAASEVNEDKELQAHISESARRNKVLQNQEIALTSAFKRCNLSRKYSDVDELEAALLKTELDGKFYNADLMHTLFCIFDMVLYAPPEEGRGFNEANPNIGKIFEKMRRIGAESVSGYAFLSSFKELENMFVIKAPQDPKNDELYHEFFVGLVATNDLRKITPNFAYIFGAFKCLPPKLNPNDNKKLLEFCAHGDDSKYVNYVIYEKIEGEDMAKLTKTCTFHEYFSWILQIVFATHIGFVGTGYTHYDLHDENVIMRPWRGNEGVGEPLKNFWIPYKMPDGRTLYVKTNKIATIIDFGRTHIELEDDNNDIEHFGVFGFESFGVFEDIARPWYDIYKILGFSMYHMLENKNFKCLDQALPLLRIIDPSFSGPKEVLYKKLKDDREDFFVYSDDLTPFEEEHDLTFFMLEMERLFPQHWSNSFFESGDPSQENDEPDGEILDCEAHCPSAKFFENAISSNTSSQNDNNDNNDNDNNDNNDNNDEAEIEDIQYESSQTPNVKSINPGGPVKGLKMSGSKSASVKSTSSRSASVKKR